MCTSSCLIDECPLIRLIGSRTQHAHCPMPLWLPTHLIPPSRCLSSALSPPPHGSSVYMMVASPQISPDALTPFPSNSAPSPWASPRALGARARAPPRTLGAVCTSWCKAVFYARILIDPPPPPRPAQSPNEQANKSRCLWLPYRVHVLEYSRTV